MLVLFLHAELINIVLNLFNMKNFVLTILLFCGFCGASLANNKVPDIFYGRRFSSGGDTLYYRVLYPKGYSDEGHKSYPLIVVLHSQAYAYTTGAHDNNKQLLSPVADLFKHPEVHDSFPAIVLFPQCEEMDAWASYTPSDSLAVVPFPEDPDASYSGELADRMINYWVKKYQVDKNRVYLIGQGFWGGSGVLDLAAREPSRYAAVVSLGGAVCPDRIKGLKKTPIRLYSSSTFTEIPITLVRDVYIGLKSFGSNKVEPIIDFPGLSEDELSTTAASSPDFLKWIFANHK